MHNNVVYAVCRAALDHGVAALRFNFRGVGGSAGSYDSGRGERDDAVAALAHLRSLPEIDSSRVSLAGYSFGAAVALRVADPDLRALVAVSAPSVAGPLTVEATCPILFVSGDRDEYSDPSDLQRIVDTLDGRAQLTIMPGVDHFWAGSDERLSEAVSTFLATHL
jgi:alpha/beta superfamily hydrolase